eukprot:5725810-Prymnesium_polylepis.1
MRRAAPLVAFATALLRPPSRRPVRSPSALSRRPVRSLRPHTRICTPAPRAAPSHALVPLPSARPAGQLSLGRALADLRQRAAALEAARQADATQAAVRAAPHDAHMTPTCRHVTPT